MKKLSLLFFIFSFAHICQAMQNEQFWSSITYEPATHQYNAAVTLIEENITDFSECYEILDVGCGRGNLSFYFASKVPQAHVHGVDKEPDIQKAKSKNSANSMQITFDIFDANKDSLPFVDQFDIVFCSATFHWIKNQESLFKGIVQSAAKNSTILINAATISTNHPLLLAFDELKQEQPYKSLFSKTDLTKEFHSLNQKTVKEWCTQHNLVVNTLNTQPNQFKFANNEELITWFGSWFGGFPSISRLDEATRTSFITALVAKYSPKIAQQDGSLVHGWPQLTLKATKPYRTAGQMY